MRTTHTYVFRNQDNESLFIPIRAESCKGAEETLQGIFDLLDISDECRNFKLTSITKQD